jgi:CBS domain-containing protein
MEDREILKAIEVIFSKESREDSLQYQYVDTAIITSLGKPPEILICEDPERFRFVSESVDLMRGLLEEFRTESQRDLFFGILRQTFDVASPYHRWAPLAFETLIRLDRPEEALHQAMTHFAITPPFSRLLTLFSENLHYEHHRFSEELLGEFADWIRELFTNPIHSAGRELIAQRHNNRPATASILRCLLKIRNQIDEIRFLRLKGKFLRRKAMKVKDIMTTDVATLGLNEELSVADDIMKLGRIRHLPVVDEGRLVGIISQRDLFKASLASAMGFGEKAKREFMKTVVVKEVMVSEVFTISPEADIEEAGKVMLEKKMGCLPVIEGDNLVGLITETDILRYYVYSKER